MSKKKFAFTDSRVQSVQNRRRSAASGTHAQGVRRERARGAGKRAAIQRGY